MPEEKDKMLTFATQAATLLIEARDQDITEVEARRLLEKALDKVFRG